MKKAIIFVAFSALLLAVSGCDFFRQLAGRPTSADIQAKRELIARMEMEHQARIDSLARVQKQLSDSLALLDSVRHAGNMVSASKLGGVSKSEVPFRYYIIVGAFSNKENASRQAKRVEDEGYAPSIIPYRNGFTAVGICPSNTLSEVFASLKEVRTKKFCPSDAWVLVNE